MNLTKEEKEFLKKIFKGIPKDETESKPVIYDGEKFFIVIPQRFARALNLKETKNKTEFKFILKKEKRNGSTLMAKMIKNDI